MRTRKGFTIVELLIVIVVIAVLAAITVAAYNGIQSHAHFAAMRSDLANLNKAIQLYYTQNGQYPITTETGDGCRTGSWCGWDQAVGDAFIPGLVPGYLSATPQLPASNTSADTYLYRSPTGADYKLIRLKQGGLDAAELSAMADLRTTGCGEADVNRWGYWSSNASKCW